jgi:hypothetical protein
MYCSVLQVYAEGTHMMVPRFERPVVYDALTVGAWNHMQRTSFVLLFHLSAVQVYAEGTHLMVPWFVRLALYDAVSVGAWNNVQRTSTILMYCSVVQVVC